MTKHMTAVSILILLLFVPVANATNVIVCDTSCGGTTSSSDSALIQARGSSGATRGTGTTTNPVLHVPKTAAIVGSQSYTYGVPMYALPGRNGSNLILNLYYNSFVWTTTTALNGRKLLTFNADHDTPSPGFRADFGWLTFNSDASGAVLTESTGSKHAAAFMPATASTPAEFRTNDGSDIRFRTGANGTWIAMYKDGLQVTYTNPSGDLSSFRPALLEDANGNFVTLTYRNTTNTALSTVTDTVGRNINFIYDASGTMLNCITAATNCTTPTIPTYTFQWNQNYVLNFAFTIGTGTLQSGTSAIKVLTDVTRPDGTSVQFSYGDWGIVNRVQELTANGSVRGSVSYNYPLASAGALPGNPGYTQGTMFDGINTGLWNYSVTRDTNGAVTSSSVTNPAGTTDTMNVSAAGLATQEVVGGLGQQCPTCPTTNIHNTTNLTWANDTLGIPRLTQTTTTLDDDLTQAATITSYDVFGNPTDIKEYDFAPTGLRGPLLRETIITYASIGNGIVNQPNDVQRKDSLGNVVSHLVARYDETPLANEPTNPLGHDSAFAATGRGNRTTFIAYANAAAGTDSITSQFTYDNLGNLLTAQLGCCTFQQHTFSAVTQYAYMDSLISGPVSGPQLTTKFTYNMSTGSLASTTDPNNLQTTYGYDIMARVISTQTPDGVVARTSYDDSSPQPSMSTSSSTSNVVQKSVFDATGKLISQSSLNGTVPFSTKSLSYDISGRLLTATNPFAPGETPQSTAYTYDPLDRVTSVTPPAQDGTTTQSPYLTLHSGASITTTDPASKQRRQVSDGLGRLIRVDEPGLSGGFAAGASPVITGSEQSVATTNGNGATAGTASVTVTPTTAADRSTQVKTSNATYAMGHFTIDGFEEAVTIDPCSDQGLIKPCPKTIWDGGTVSLTINGVAMSVPYGSSSTGTTIATALASAFAGSNTACIVTASTNIVSVRALTAGAAGNSIKLSGSSTSKDPADFTPPSFVPQPYTPTLTGGADDVYTTFFDTGTVTATFTVNGTSHPETVPYGSSDTGATLASALAQKLNSDAGANSLVIASASANVLNLTTVATGAGTAYPLSASSATNSPYFPSGTSSFTATASGTAFTPGANGTLYDSGSIVATLKGFTTASFQESVTFGQGSTPTSVATSIAAAFHNDPFSPVDAATDGAATINFKARTKGTDANSYAITIAEQSSQQSSFPSPSFPTVNTTLASGVNPTPSLDASVAVSTAYTYDALDNLVLVQQGQQLRRYVYDSLGRMTSSTIPETGNQAVTYTYTDFGPVAQRFDPRVLTGTTTHITTTYGYDPLNRLHTVTYNDGTPGTTYTYAPPLSANNTGTLVSSVTTNPVPGTTVPAISETFQYDLVGRTTQSAKSIAGTTYVAQFHYNPDATLASVTYPSNRVVSYAYDTVGRLSKISSNGSDLLSIGSNYNAAGKVLGASYGNGVSVTYGYNSQLELSRLRYATPSAPILDLAYNYGGGQNNGQISGITDNVVPARSTSYAYDELRRLKVAQTNDLTSANTWKLQFAYDRYGNRVSQIDAAGTASAPNTQYVVDPTTNHVAGIVYDAAGNMTSGALSNTFDAESRLTHVGGNANTYVYDAGGLRVIKNGTSYVYANGHVIAEYANGAAAGTPTVEYIYSGGRLLSTITGGVMNYHHPDHLSTRVSTDSSATVTRTFAHLPFGETWYETLAGSKWKFTTYERDTESGLDYAQARFDSPALGRFVTMDPLSGSTSNPQSLNRYSYGSNDPVNQVDPKGKAGGNWTCLLDEHGDCVGGDYSGLFATMGMGLWADPFGPMTDPTKWDPLGEGEEAYKAQRDQGWADDTSGAIAGTTEIASGSMGGPDLSATSSSSGDGDGTRPCDPSERHPDTQACVHADPYVFMDIKDDAPANHVNYNSEGAGLYKYGSFASCLDSNHSKGCTAEQIALGELQNPNCRAAQSALQSFHDDVNRLTGKALAWSLFFGAIGGGAEEWRKKPGGFAPKFNITSALLAMDVQLFMMLQEKNKLEDEHLLACGWVYR